ASLQVFDSLRLVKLTHLHAGVATNSSEYGWHQKIKHLSWFKYEWSPLSLLQSDQKTGLQAN
ncbi:hypothetical protein, partial [Weissella viridescens]|uniref:hypothetical protein n=1 Tax=Weissella viridescens TaxID=1629 RepID=UPI003AA92D53